MLSFESGWPTLSTNPFKHLFSVGSLWGVSERLMNYYFDPFYLIAVQWLQRTHDQHMDNASSTPRSLLHL